MRTIEKQSYASLEVVISDDCSTDDTEQTILGIIDSYKYPIKYHRHSTNQGYDRNLRSAIELASGQYAIVIGNDDTINPDYDLKRLFAFLESNEFPDIGFTNFTEAATGEVVQRATATSVLGTGPETAFKYYSCFSFVGGLVLRRAFFLKYNTDKYDGSIYCQIYLAALAVSSGGRLFSIHEPVVLKDILPEEQNRKSYKDTIARKWSDYRSADGGLPSVIQVLTAAFEDAKVLDRQLRYDILRRIYSKTFPYWVVNYRHHNAFPAALGLVQGMQPWRLPELRFLTLIDKARIYGTYFFSSVAGLIVPLWFFKHYASRVHGKVGL